MKRLEVNSHNERYYTKDFISGFRCGTKRQLQSDLIVIDKIRAEIDNARFIDKDTRICKNANASGLEVALQIIDKYKAESEG